MSTPTLTKSTLPGSLGEIFVDVRGGGRRSPRPAIVILHGFKGFKDWGVFPPFAERLARAGFTAVSLNVSGSGVDDRGEAVFTERFGRNTFSGELHDVGVVVDALAAGELGVAPPSVIGIVGHSRGGGMAVLQTARDPRIRALVTWAAISHVDRMPGMAKAWREAGHIVVENSRTGQKLPLFTDVLDDVEQNGNGTLDIPLAASRVNVPWLIVHGTDDPTVPVSEAERLGAASGRVTTQLVTLDNAGHTFGASHPFQGFTPVLDRVVTSTISWFSKHLL
jgi:dipeptidyl aminopeptidase/acylaminoacyl peptidase